VDKDGKLRGVVTVADLEAKMTRTSENLTAADIATTHLITAYPDESLHDVLHRLGDSEVGRIPVIDRKDPSKFVGVLRRRDIVRAFSKAQSKRRKF
jgi:CIC family chloride channel protein